MDNDYIILFDENGSPYIAHAFGDRLRSAATSVGNSATSAYGNAKAGVGRGIRATHKYIDKIVENGRTRYFYTQEELKAYYNEKAKPAINKATQNARAATGRAVTAVGDTASNVVAKGKMVTNQAGETARNLAANGKTIAGNVAQNARSARSEAARRAEEALQRGKSSTAQMRTEFRNKAEQAGRAAGNTAKNVAAKGKEVTEGVKAYNKWNNDPSTGTYNAVKNNKVASSIDRARRKLDDSLDNTAIKLASNMEGENVWKAYKAANKRAMDARAAGNPSEKFDSEADQLYEKWRKTPHGKFLNDSFIANAQVNGVKDTVQDRINEASESVKSAASKAKTAVGNAAEEVSEAAKNVATKGKAAVESASGSARAAIQNGTAKAEDYAKAAHEIATSVASATKDKAGSAINALSNSLGGFIKGIKASGNKLSFPGGKTITIPEKYISENVIPESYITETIIPEIIEYEHTLHERNG